jgi:hypothetical protein
MAPQREGRRRNRSGIAVSGRAPTFKYSVVLACITLISGCAQTAPQSTAGPIDPAKYTDIELYATVVNAGSSRGYTVFEGRSVAVTVLPDSSARIVITHTSAPGFENAHERLKWIDAGTPHFPPSLPTGTNMPLKAGSFSYLPFPPKLSFRQIVALEPSPDRIASVVMGDPGPSAAHAQKFYLAMQLATLLAIAPVSAPARHAAWKALVSLPGIHGCTGGRDSAGRSGRWMCIGTPPDELRILTSTRAQQVLSVEELLMAPSLRYPGVPAGSVIESNTYLT